MTVNMFFEIFQKAVAAWVVRGIRLRDDSSIAPTAVYIVAMVAAKVA